MNDNIDRLSELKIDRSELPKKPRRWPWILAGVVVAVAVVAMLLRAIQNGPVEVTAETVRLAETGSGTANHQNRNRSDIRHPKAAKVAEIV